MGIVGESGSGKSVTSASVMRLMPAKTGKIVDGSIIFDGVDIRSLSESQMEKFRGDECCMIFQNPMTSLDPVFKIGHQMVEMIREHEKISKKDACSSGYRGSCCQTVTADTENAAPGCGRKRDAESEEA